jgi:hypothetical protein
MSAPANDMNRRGFLAPALNPICDRDDCARYLADSGDENLCGAISWFTFFRTLCGRA